jgi:hypothetical protein
MTDDAHTAVNEAGGAQPDQASVPLEWSTNGRDGDVPRPATKDRWLHASEWASAPGPEVGAARSAR